MPKILIFALLAIVLSSCGSSNRTTNTYTKERNTITANQAKAKGVVSYATQFKGVPYKYGGTTRSGMDCSGLIYTAFNKQNIALPRISSDMATQGIAIDLSKATTGDLVFFRTNKNSRQINHVGLVVSVKQGDVRFIHATTSSGVIVSSLKESYWRRAYVKARRII